MFKLSDWNDFCCENILFRSNFCIEIDFSTMKGIIWFVLIMFQLPRAKDTAALSGGGLKRLVKSVGDTVFSLTTKMPESDQV